MKVEQHTRKASQFRSSRSRPRNFVAYYANEYEEDCFGVGSGFSCPGSLDVKTLDNALFDAYDRCDYGRTRRSRPSHREEGFVLLNELPTDPTPPNDWIEGFIRIVSGYMNKNLQCESGVWHADQTTEI